MPRGTDREELPLKTLAYLDAGSGSIMIQAVLGGLAGLAVVVRLFGTKIKRTVLFWRRDTPAAPASPAGAENVSTRVSDEQAV